jgi:hypothetical protein
MKATLIIIENEQDHAQAKALAEELSSYLMDQHVLSR